MGIHRKDRYLKLWFQFCPCLIIVLPCFFKLFLTEKVIQRCQIGWVFFYPSSQFTKSPDPCFRKDLPPLLGIEFSVLKFFLCKKSCFATFKCIVCFAQAAFTKQQIYLHTRKGKNITEYLLKALLWKPLETRVALLLWTGHATKSDEFSEKFQTASTPLIFGKLHCNFFIMDMVACLQVGIRAG